MCVYIWMKYLYIWSFIICTAQAILFIRMSMYISITWPGPTTSARHDPVRTHAGRSLCCGFGPLRKQSLTTDRENNRVLPALHGCMHALLQASRVHTTQPTATHTQTHRLIDQCVAFVASIPNRIKQRVWQQLIIDRSVTDCTASSARCLV